MRSSKAVYTMVAVAALLLSAVARAQEGRGEVVYVPTPQVAVDEMLKIAKVSANDFLVDLGSGDGRIVIEAAKRGAQAEDPRAQARHAGGGARLRHGRVAAG